MGGSAFTSGPEPLNTPRMPPAVYKAVKAQCTAKLQEEFSCVAIPIEGPAKADHGDVDILVCWPKRHFADRKSALEAVEKTLQARRAILTLGEASANFAIPWPEAEGDRRSQPRFVQVDVRICDTLQNLQWILFKHAHSIIWNILGSVIRPYGLTVDEEALFIRVPEIENFNRKRSKVYLSSEPVEILHFLGLPLGEFWERPFGTMQELFEYAAQCRLFWVRPADLSEGIDATEVGIMDGESFKDRKALKSNDRRRMNMRPGFRAWIDEFTSECRKKGLYSVQPRTREEVTEEALQRFGARDEFYQRRKDFLCDQQRDRILKMIKASARPADPSDPKMIAYRSCQIKALKRIIFEDDRQYGVTMDRGSTVGEDGFYKEDEVHKFLEAHGSEVGDVAFARQQQVYLEIKARNFSQN